MRIKVLQATHPEMIRSLDTARLRELYLASEIFAPGEICLTYSHVERFIVGGAQPLKEGLKLATAKEVGSDPFLARREMGVINIGGVGHVTIDGSHYELGPRDGLYIGAGSANVLFESKDAAAPAKFYLASSPSHAHHPSVRIPVAEAKPMPMGAPETSNERTIYQYVNPDICKSSRIPSLRRVRLRARRHPARGWRLARALAPLHRLRK